MRSGYHVRRATIEDLPALLSMWQSLSLPTAELQHRLTEFQVLESPSGLLGAVGFEIIGREGRIHGEAFSDFGFADHFRPELWERLQAVARSKGVVRAWTLESAPFWKRNGFRTAATEQLARLPAAWKEQGPNWLYIKLQEEIDEARLSQQVTALQAAEREQTLRLARRTKLIKTLALLAAIILALFVICAAVYLLKPHPGLSGH